jgi:hypothetical protein
MITRFSTPDGLKSVLSPSMASELWGLDLRKWPFEAIGAIGAVNRRGGLARVRRGGPEGDGLNRVGMASKGRAMASKATELVGIEATSLRRAFPRSTTTTSDRLRLGSSTHSDHPGSLPTPYALVGPQQAQQAQKHGGPNGTAQD